MGPRAAATVELAVDVLGKLKNDHAKVKELFDQFEHAEDAEERATIIKTALQELEVHAQLEERILYPAFREHLKEEDMIDEAFEEHHVVHLLIKELKGSRAKQGRRDAKFMVLVENVKHHIREEEGSLFPEVEGLDLDWEALSAKVEKKRAQLESHGRRSKG
ncbi:hemerythrin [Nitrospira sp.]|nr:hemerythrin [Nitrospira sp.]